MKPLAYLFGPFVGDLSWEFFRFAPYAIYLKKENPQVKFIVFTRPSRFDLYGIYADILVPLKIPNDKNLKKKCFTVQSFLTKNYNHIARIFASKYKKKYQIIDHIYPDISDWRYKLKWQFPRKNMDYDFKTRSKNKQIAKSLVKENNILIDSSLLYDKEIPECILIDDLCENINRLVNNYDTTLLGVLIECLKICKCVVGNLNYNMSHLAILLKKPLICINNEMSEDSIKLLNPLNTPIIYANGIDTGIEKYENNI